MTKNTQTTLGNSLKSFLFGVILLLIAISCKDIETTSSSAADEDTGGLTASLIWPDQNEEVISTSSPFITNMPASVTTVRAVITGDGMDQMQQDFSASAGSGTITGVPAGDNRKLSIFGLKSDNTVEYVGDSTTVTVSKGATANAGTINMRTYTNSTLFSDNFNGETVGNTASNWSLFFGSINLLTVQTDPTDGSNKTLRGNGSNIAYRTGAPTGDREFSFRFYIASNSNVLDVFEAGINFAACNFGVDGPNATSSEIKCGSTSVGSATNNQWHSAKFILDYNDLKYEFYLNDSKVYTKSGTSSISTSTWFGSAFFDVNSDTVYFDDIVIKDINYLIP